MRHLWHVLFVLSVKPAIFFGYIQRWAAQEIRACCEIHHIPWLLLNLVLWMPTRLACTVLYAAARATHRKEMNALGAAPVRSH